MKFLFYYILFFTSYLLCGCSTWKRDIHQTQIIEELCLEQSIETALEKEGFEIGDWPSYAWWSMFEDEQLTRLMEETIKDNPSLQSAIARMRSAQAMANEVRSALFPHLHFHFKEDYQHLSKDSLDRFPPSLVPAVINQIFLGVDFEYEIDFFGKNQEKYRAALGKFKAQKTEMSQSLLLITISFAEAYFTYQSNLLRVDLYKKLIEKRTHFLQLMEERFQSGISARADVLAVNADLLKEKENLQIVEKALTLSQNQMKALLGLSPDTKKVHFTFPLASFHRSFPLPENLPINLVARRPDLMAQVFRVEAAAHEIGAAKAAFFPNVNLASFFRLETLSWATLFTADSLASSLAPALSLPLFVGGKLTANLEKKRSEFHAVVNDYNAMLLNAAKEVANQLKIVETLNQQKELQLEAIAEISGVAKLVSARFQNGIDALLPLLHAQIEVLEAGLKEITIHYQRHLAILHLIQALGGGYCSEKWQGEEDV